MSDLTAARREASAWGAFPDPVVSHSQRASRQRKLKPRFKIDAASRQPQGPTRVSGSVIDLPEGLKCHCGRPIVSGQLVTPVEGEPGKYEHAWCRCVRPGRRYW